MASGWWRRTLRTLVIPSTWRSWSPGPASGPGMGGMPLESLREPFELLRAERAEPSRLQVHHVDQADKVHAALIEAVPAVALGSLAVAVSVILAAVRQHVVLARDEEDLACADP